MTQVYFISNNSIMYAYMHEVCMYMVLLVLTCYGKCDRQKITFQSQLSPSKGSRDPTQVLGLVWQML